MIKIICLGKLKENYLSLLVDDYLKRINKFHKIELIELKDQEDLEKEAVNILKLISPKDYIITLEIEGKEYTSLDFAKFMDQIFINNSTVVFVIGSSTGLHKNVKDRSDLALSFSRFTMPHGLFRGVLLEQIYRSFKINNGDTYHK